MQRTTNRPMIVILAIVLFQVLTVAPGVHGEDFMLHSVMRVVKPDTLQHYVDVLADDSFEGRAMGSRGGQAAAGWLVRKFQQDQLQPAGADGSFFQSFEGGGRNILAMLEGSDPILKKQVIVVGAHYDHVGYGSPNNS